MSWEAAKGGAQGNLQGSIGGAQAGSAGGPWGALAGGIAGGVIGGITGYMDANDAVKRRKAKQAAWEKAQRMLAQLRQEQARARFEVMRNSYSPAQGQVTQMYGSGSAPSLAENPIPGASLTGDFNPAKGK
jgi:outer membrane lipoprotein SlyB